MHDIYYSLKESRNLGVYAIERKKSGVVTRIQVGSGHGCINRDGTKMLDSFIATQAEDINRVRFLLSISVTTISHVALHRTGTYSASTLLHGKSRSDRKSSRCPTWTMEFFDTNVAMVR